MHKVILKITWQVFTHKVINSGYVDVVKEQCGCTIVYKLKIKNNNHIRSSLLELYNQKVRRICVIILFYILRIYFWILCEFLSLYGDEYQNMDPQQCPTRKLFMRKRQTIVQNDSNHRNINIILFPRPGMAVCLCPRYVRYQIHNTFRVKIILQKFNMEFKKKILCRMICND